MAKGSNLIRLKDKDARTGQGMKIIIPQIKMSNIKPGRQINDNYIIICEILTGIVKGNLAFVFYNI